MMMIFTKQLCISVNNETIPVQWKCAELAHFEVTNDDLCVSVPQAKIKLELTYTAPAGSGGGGGDGGDDEDGDEDDEEGGGEGVTRMSV